MKSLRSTMVVATICTALALPSAAGAAGHYKAVNEPERMYYGHVSMIGSEPGAPAPRIIGGDGLEKDAVLNMPVLPGDTLVTPAGVRCELMFDTGTLIRLDFDSRLKLETLMAPSLSSARDVTNLVLERGGLYIMYRQYDRKELLQVKAGAAAVMFKHGTVASVSVDGQGLISSRVKFGRADIMAVRKSGDAWPSTNKVEAGKTLNVQPDGRAEAGVLAEPTAFEGWNDKVNADYEASHKGVTVLPKPVQNLPDAVQYFAQVYGSKYGEWVWDDYLGYVWRPYIDDDIYPSGSWRPYACGSWTSSGGRMFWVPEETWGWVPYHLGIWHWDEKLGWVWLPGSFFAPAWVDWEFFYGYSGWRPWSLFDWLLAGYYGFAYDGDYWGYGLQNVGIGQILMRNGTAGVSSAGSLPISPEMTSILARAGKGLAAGDQRLVSSAKSVGGQLAMVKTGSLNVSRIQNVSVSFTTLSKAPGAPTAAKGSTIARITAADAEARAARALDLNGTAADARASSSGRTSVSAAPAAVGTARGQAQAVVPGNRGQSAVRASSIADWNPDIRIAGRLHVSIEYSSVENQVRCPALGISSADRMLGRFSLVMTPRGVSQARSADLGSGTWAGSAVTSNKTSARSGKGTADSGSSKQSSGSSRK